MLTKNSKIIDNLKQAWANSPRRLPIVSFYFGYSFLLPGIFSFATSYLVIRHSSLGLWGEFVYIQGLVLFLFLLSQWGGKEILLREFSKHPAQTRENWHLNVFPRSLLLLSSIGLLFVLFPIEIAIPCALWLFFLWMGKMTEVFSVYQKDFGWLLASEFMYWIVFACLLFFSFPIGISSMVWASAVATLFKALCLIWKTRPPLFPLILSKPNVRLLKEGIHFLLLGLIGLLEARVDIFCIKKIVGNEAVGSYSVFFTCLLLLKNLPVFFLEPFMKNLFRAKESVFGEIKGQLGIFGFFLIIFGVFLIGNFCSHFYGLSYSYFFYGAAVLYAWPRYLFTTDIYLLFKQKRELLLVWATLLGLTANVVFDFLWLPAHGVESALFAATLGQWVIFIFLKIYPNSLMPFKRRGRL